MRNRILRSGISFNAVLDNIAFGVVDNRSIKDYALVQNIRHYFSYKPDQITRIDGAYINPFQFPFTAFGHLSAVTAGGVNPKYPRRIAPVQNCFYHTFEVNLGNIQSGFFFGLANARVKRAFFGQSFPAHARTRCEMGLRPGVAPTGYLNEKHTDKKCQARIDPKRAPTIKQMFEKVAYEQWNGRKLYRWLNDIGFQTKTGKKLVLSNIYLILRNPFYYGEFEFPIGSGNWYTGKHTPIITKELFDKVQATINENFVPKTESKEFAFTKLIKCGHCGSGISADEKFRKLKDGGTNRHVYYFCTNARNIDCKNPPISETALIEELSALMDEVNLDDLGIKARIEQEINRFNKFNVMLGNKHQSKDINVDIRNYAKYLLKEGAIIEKRELLSCLKSKLTLKNKKLLSANYCNNQLILLFLVRKHLNKFLFASFINKRLNDCSILESFRNAFQNNVTQ